ncbi:MAG TPA: hypothetical protein VKR58_09525 [Aquella sp.]|nr:hypothetical protein [Aquella sp.]
MLKTLRDYVTESLEILMDIAEDDSLYDVDTRMQAASIILSYTVQDNKE